MRLSALSYDEHQAFKARILHEICLVINNDPKMLAEVRRIKALADRLPQDPGVCSPLRRWLEDLRKLEGRAWVFMRSCYEQGELPSSLPCYHWSDVFSQTYCTTP